MSKLTELLTKRFVIRKSLIGKNGIINSTGDIILIQRSNY